MPLFQSDDSTGLVCRSFRRLKVRHPRALGERLALEPARPGPRPRARALAVRPGQLGGLKGTATMSAVWDGAVTYTVPSVPPIHR